MMRFLVGLGLGAAGSAVTCAITEAPPWWWLVGLTITVLVWCGEFIGDVLG